MGVAVAVAVALAVGVSKCDVIGDDVGVGVDVASGVLDSVDAGVFERFKPGVPVSFGVDVIDGT